MGNLKYGRKRNKKSKASRRVHQLRRERRQALLSEPARADGFQEPLPIVKVEPPEEENITIKEEFSEDITIKEQFLEDTTIKEELLEEITIKEELLFQEDPLDITVNSMSYIKEESAAESTSHIKEKPIEELEKSVQESNSPVSRQRISPRKKKEFILEDKQTPQNSNEQLENAKDIITYPKRRSVLKRNLDNVDLMFLDFSTRFKALSSKRQTILRRTLCRVMSQAEIEEITER